MERIRPILFNTEMVRAILAGRKTATRRVVNPVVWKDFVCEGGKVLHYFDQKKNIFESPIYRAPYQVGDILYVRETWNYGYIETSDSPGNSEAWFEPLQPAEEHGPCIEALNRYFYKADENEPGSDVGMVWRPSIHMPKEAARIWLKVPGVGVERLHDMTLDDFLSEGVVIRPEAFNDPENAYWQARREFARIWDSAIGKSQTEINPWVWVIKFERCEKPEREDE